MRIASAILAALALAGCGENAAAPSAAKPVGHESAGSVVQFADCTDWRAGTRSEREATVQALRGQLTPQRSQTAASPLSDERAYAIFEKACAPVYSQSLRLYKLYARAQGFAPLSQ